MRIINLVRELGDKPKLFGALSDATRDALWRKIRDRAGLGPELDSAGRVIREGLNFHDSRATFATWAGALIRRPEHRALIFCPSLVRLGTKI